MKTECIAFIILIGCSLAADARTVVFPGERSSISIPESWTQQDVKGALFAAKDGEKGLSMAIRVTSNPNDRRYDISRIDHVKKGMSESLDKDGANMEFGGDEATTIDGVPSFCSDFTFAASASSTVYGRVYGIAANGKLYLIILESLDPDENSELEAIARSFRFDHPPELPDDSYEAGYQVGQYLMPLLMSAGILLVIRRLFSYKSGKS